MLPRILASQVLRQSSRTLLRSSRSPLLRKASSQFFNGFARWNSSQPLKVDKPQLMIAFTCKKCDTRSSHTFSKQAYTNGTVLIQCPGCKNRHLIADHLKIFSDERVNIQDLLAAQNESVSFSVEDLVFEDIPEKLKKVIGHHAKDAPEEYKQKRQVEGGALPDGSDTDK
ncbi:Heat shock protein with a zinc finger motif [Komagataella kurtzmanii]|nr:Heat shock protein with a zinc finger motif [Komagataella kurtzmanii]